MKLDPRNADALGTLGKFEAEAGRPSGAIGLYDRASAIDQERVEYVWNAIDLQVASDREAGLDERLERVLERDPLDAKAAHMLAERMLDQGNLGRAESLAGRALRFGAGAVALDVQGRVALERGDFPAAVRALGLSVELRPNAPSTRYQLGRALAADGSIDEAREMLHTALEGDDFPEAGAARAELARLDSEGRDG